MTTLTIKTDENNDLYLPDGENLSLIFDEDACSQNILQATLMRAGEDIHDTTSGVDYLGTIFTPQPDEGAARESISDAILSAPDTISIEQLAISVSGNSFNYVALVNTVYGPIKVSK